MTFTIDPYRFTPPSEGKRLFMWGGNGVGQLGDGTTTQRNAPVPIGADEWTHVTIGVFNTLARKTDGTLWATGYGDVGQLGNGGIADSTVFLQVNSDTDWSGEMSIGLAHMLALKTDGTLWAWGLGLDGALGTGGTGNELDPVQIGSHTDWTGVDAGFQHSLGRRSNGTLWSWGFSGFGALGQGTTTNLTVPTQVGVLTTWTSEFRAGEFASAGVHTNGRAYLWGNAQAGATIFWNTNVPVQVDATFDYVAARPGSNYFHLLKNDGTVWAFGANWLGELGDGGTVHNELPLVQIGSDTNWTSTQDAMYQTSVALRDDGTIWSWGRGATGAIGDGFTANRTSPVQIGVSTNWTFVMGAYDSAGGLRSA